jgi:hypothetical protein
MIEKDGHTDVASSRRMCKTIIEDANDILESLPAMEAALPTWWTNKLAKCSAYMNGARDYLVYSDSPKMEESVDMGVIQEDQVTVGDYQTKHFDICPSAVALYKDITVSDAAIESAMLHDMLFKVEKQAIAANSATSEMVDKTQHYADMIMELAKEMGMEEEHSYIEDTHMAKMKELAEDDTEEADNDMLPPSVRMMNAS